MKAKVAGDLIQVKKWGAVGKVWCCGLVNEVEKQSARVKGTHLALYSTGLSHIT